MEPESFNTRTSRNDLSTTKGNSEGDEGEFLDYHHPPAFCINDFLRLYSIEPTARSQECDLLILDGDVVAADIRRSDYDAIDDQEVI